MHLHFPMLWQQQQSPKWVSAKVFDYFSIVVAVVSPQLLWPQDEQHHEEDGHEVRHDVAPVVHIENVDTAVHEDGWDEVHDVDVPCDVGEGHEDVHCDDEVVGVVHVVDIVGIGGEDNWHMNGVGGCALVEDGGWRL